METKDSKYYVQKLQELADKHTLLKKEVEGLVLEGEKIEDKLKDVDRVFAITATINTVMEEMDTIEKEYYNILKEYENKK